MSEEDTDAHLYDDLTFKRGTTCVPRSNSYLLSREENEICSPSTGSFITMYYSVPTNMQPIPLHDEHYSDFKSNEQWLPLPSNNDFGFPAIKHIETGQILVKYPYIAS